MGVKRKLDVEIDSDEEYENNSNIDSENEYETNHQATIRMKKDEINKYKDELKKRKVENIDEEVMIKLQEEALEKQGKVMKDLSKIIIQPIQFKVKLSKSKNFITCFTYSDDGKFLFTGNSDGDINKWDVNGGNSLAMVKGGKRHSAHKYHKSRVSAIASSKEFVVSGDLEKKIFVWNMELVLKKTLIKHRGEITSLVFRRNTVQLFSGDRKGIIFVWDFELMNTIQELIGHTTAITGLDSDLANHFVSCSGIGEPCVKLWKLERDGRVDYNLPKKSYDLSIECISMINEKFFVAGTTSNKIYLWDGIAKKSPIDTVTDAHDLPADGKLKVSNEINVVSICALKHTNVFASGSNLSQAKVWKVVDGKKENLTIQLLFVLPDITGYVNDLKFSPGGKDLAVATSNQHKRHRLHQRCPDTKSMIKIFKLFE